MATFWFVSMGSDSSKGQLNAANVLGVLEGKGDRGGGRRGRSVLFHFSFV